MVVIILSIILVSLLLSIDNIIPILLIADSLPKKKLKNLALFIGLFLGALLRIILVFFAGRIFQFGTPIYILSGIFLLYIGLKGLIKKEEGEGKRKRAVGFLSVALSIGVIDITLSLDNVAALIAITQSFSLLFIGILISVLILFGLSFFINTLIRKIKGLDIAAYMAILFLAFKFLAFPFGVTVSNTLTSGIIILICLIAVIYGTIIASKSKFS